MLPKDDHPLLRDCEHCGKMTLSDAADWARGSRGQDVDGRRAEFVRLVEAPCACRKKVDRKSVAFSAAC